MLPNANKKEIIKQAREPGKRRKTFFFNRICQLCLYAHLKIT
jgi:hypothetical protein